MASSWGTTSFAQNSSAVRAMARCSSLRSSGVKISAGARSSMRNEPPLMARVVIRPLAEERATGQEACRTLLAFEDSRGALSAAHAHGDHAIAGVAPLHFAQDGGGEFGAGASQRMAQRDGAAVDVDPFDIEARFADDGQRL